MTNTNGVKAQAEKLLALIGEYWEIAYAEGVAGATHDDQDGSAQRAWSEITAAVAALAQQPAAVEDKPTQEEWASLREEPPTEEPSAQEIAAEALAISAALERADPDLPEFLASRKAGQEAVAAEPRALLLSQKELADLHAASFDGRDGKFDVDGFALALQAAVLEESGADIALDVYGQCAIAIKPLVDAGQLPASVVESVQELVEFRLAAPPAAAPGEVELPPLPDQPSGCNQGNACPWSEEDSMTGRSVCRRCGARSSGSCQ